MIDALRRWRWDRQTTRFVMAAIAVAIGLTNLISALIASPNGTVATWVADVSDNVLNGSRSFVAVAGFLLILLGRGLALGRRTAWLVAVILLEGSAIGHMVKGLDIAEATAASIAAVILASQSEHFTARLDMPSVARALRSIGLFAAGFLVYAAVGLAINRDHFAPPLSTGDAIKEFFARLVFTSVNEIHGATLEARWFLRSISVVWVGLVVYTVIVLLRPRLRPFAVSADDRDQAERILRQDGRSTTSPMTLWEGQEILLSANRRAYVSYRLIGDVALVLGDPVGPAEEMGPVVDDFLAACTTAGWTPCLYGITPHTLDIFTQRGFATIQVAEDAIVWLEQLEFKGKKWQDVRSAINKANREGVRFEWFDQATGDRAIRDQLWEISEAWLAEKGLPEMGFTLGKLTDPPDPTVRTAIAIDANGRVHAFVTWLPVPAERGWVIDLMRRRPDSVRGVMEFLIAQSAMSFKDDGDRMFSLAAAPLARVERPGEDVTTLQRGLDLIAARLDAYYHFAPLFEFKRKFDPAWSPQYVAYPGYSSLPKITVAIVRAYLPNLSVTDVASQIGAAAVSSARRLIPTRGDATTAEGEPEPKPSPSGG